jgi:hypothetical protein
MLGTALDLLSDPRAQTLNDYERFVQVFDIEPPEGYRDIETFNRDLDVALDRVHVDRRENIDQTLRHGTQSVHNLFGEGFDLAERLRVKIDKAVENYIASMADDEKHPLLQRKQRQFDYSASCYAAS